MKRRLWLGGFARLATLAVLSLPVAVKAGTRSPACSAPLTRQIPPRADDAPAASAFLGSIAALGDDAREAAIASAFASGNLPSFLRRLQPVHLADETGTIDITLCVTPDYLAIGDDDDYLLTPMRLETALRIARQFDFVLPTARIVDAIYRQSTLQLAPRPLPAGDSMRSTDYYRRHNELLRQQRLAAGAAAADTGLRAGDKKDLVLTGRLWSRLDRVAIYGWHRLDGRPIQPLSTVHSDRYADYSHGVRLVSTTAFVNGMPRDLLELLQDPELSRLLSSEGRLPRLRELIADLSTRSLKTAAVSGPAPHLGLPQPPR